MSSDNLSPVQAEMFSKGQPVTLHVPGIPPSFKNNKMLVAKDRHGRALRTPFLITRPDLQKRMEKLTDNLVSQLLCVYRTASDGMQTGCSLQSWIASHVPADDCWTMVPEIQIRAELCEPGNEGAAITITPL